MGARYYNPALGRFISRDPTGYAGSGINLYAYCGDNPLVYTDPTGLCRDRGWNAEANKPYTTWDIILGGRFRGRGHTDEGGEGRQPLHQRQRANDRFHRDLGGHSVRRFARHRRSGGGWPVGLRTGNGGLQPNRGGPKRLATVP